MIRKSFQIFRCIEIGKNIGFNVVLILSSINYIYWTPFHSLQTRDLSLYELTRISRANVIFVAPILCIAKLCCTVTDCNYITLVNPSALTFNRKWFQYRLFFSLTCDSFSQSYYKLIMINLIIFSAFHIFTFFLEYRNLFLWICIKNLKSNEIIFEVRYRT